MFLTAPYNRAGFIVCLPSGRNLIFREDSNKFSELISMICRTSTFLSATEFIHAETVCTKFFHLFVGGSKRVCCEQVAQGRLFLDKSTTSRVLFYKQHISSTLDYLVGLIRLSGRLIILITLFHYIFQ